MRTTAKAQRTQRNAERGESPDRRSSDTRTATRGSRSVCSTHVNAFRSAAAALLLLIVCAGAHAAPNPRARGLKLFMDGQYDKAVLYLEAAFAAEPKDAHLIDKLALCCIRTGDYARAAQLMRTAAKTGGTASFRMQQEAQALERIAAARGRDAEAAGDAIRKLPSAADRIVSPDRADGDAKASGDTKSGAARPWFMSPADLLTAATRANTYHPDVPLEAAMLLGSLRFDQQRYAEAADAYAQAAKAKYAGFGFPNLQQYIIALVEAGRHMDALAAFDSHQAQVPEQRPQAFDAALLRAHLTLADSALESAPTNKGRLLMARRILVKGLDRIPSQGAERDQLAARLLQVKIALCKVLTAEGDEAIAKGDTRAAIIAYDDVRQLCKGIEPELYYATHNKWYALSRDAEKRFLEGFELQRDGDYRAAIAAFDDVLRRWPRAKHAHKALFYKASAYENLRKYAQATQCYKQLLATYPESGFVPWACIEIGEHCAIAGEDYDECIRWLREAVKRQPQGHNSDLAQYWLAEVYWEKLRNYKQSYIELKKFMKLYPQSQVRRRAELRIEYIERFGLKNVDGRKAMEGKSKAKPRKRK